MAKTKLTLRVPTKGKKAGEQIEVDADQVDALVQNGLALRVKPGPKSDKD
jgi:hypothetical protein